MPRRNKRTNSHNHGGYGRGRGRGRGRGGSNGVPTPVVPAATPTRRAPRHSYLHTNAEFDVIIQQWEEPPSAPDENGLGNMNRRWRPRGGGTPGSRSGAVRGRDSPWRGNSTPRGVGSGRGNGRGGRGWGRGRGVDNGGNHRPHLGHVNAGPRARKPIGKDAPLSDLLYAQRPLLRPVKFVRATLNPFLFQQPEEVLKPASASQAADTTDMSHVPTAARVAQLFRDSAPDSDSESEDQAFEGALEEIDFADMAQIRAEVDAIAHDTAAMDQGAEDDQDEIEEVDFADLAAIRAKVDAKEPCAASRDNVVEEVFTGVYNQIKDSTQVSSAMDIAGADQPLAMQQTTSLSPSFTLDHSHDPEASVEISNPFIYQSNSHTPDAIVVEEEASLTCDAPSNISIGEPSVSTPSEAHPQHTGDLPPPSPIHGDAHPLFVVDTAPSRPVSGRPASDVILIDRAGHGETLGDQDEELIVYVAPHPRSGRASPVPAFPRVKLPQTSMLTGKSLDMGGLRSPIREDEVDPLLPDDPDGGARAGAEGEVGDEYHLSLASLSIGPTISASTPTSVPPAAHPSRTDAASRARKEVRFQRPRQRQNKQSRMDFGAYEAMMSEARLREEDARERQCPRWETRRRGDSDVDWGTEDEEDQEGQLEDKVDALSDGLGGMEIDPDLKMDVDAMRGFVKSMSAEGSRFVTIDDIEDEAQLQQEDQEDEGGPEGSSDSELSDEEEEDEDEEEEAFQTEEGFLIGESKDDDESSEDSDDDDLSPRAGFQARLRKMREQNHGQLPRNVQESDGDEDEDSEGASQPLPFTRSANDEEFIARINDLLEENSQILASRNQKEKEALLRDLPQGDVDERDVESFRDDPEFTTPVNKKKKGKGKEFTGELSAELKAQWAKDRAKKAEQKQQRQAAQLLAALDPLSADATAGAKGQTHTSRKAMRAAARLDPNEALSIAPGAIVNPDSLEAAMRRFAEDVGGRKSMALPPMDKGMRKLVHEMAQVFGIKSVSKGQGKGRYTTLFRASRTGVGVKEGKVRAVMKRFGHAGRGGGGKKGKGGEGGERKGRDKGGQMPRQREGDEVGKEAPKIGESNIGFKMLASMGWSEGDRIGGTASVGLEVPLTAIIKHSKLGLGATR